MFISFACLHDNTQVMKVFLISQDKMESFKIIDTCITILEQINEEKYEKYLVHGLLMFYIVGVFFQENISIFFFFDFLKIKLLFKQVHV